MKSCGSEYGKKQVICDAVGTAVEAGDVKKRRGLPQQQTFQKPHQDPNSQK